VIILLLGGAQGLGFLRIVGTVVFVLALVVPFLQLGRHKRISLVRVYEEGLKWTTAKGAEHKKSFDVVTEAYRKDVRYMSGDRELRRDAEVRLVFSDGSNVTFRDLKDYDEFIKCVQPAVAQRQLSAALAAMEDSGVQFGPVQVDREGLSFGGARCGWKDVDQITIEEGYLYLYTDSGKRPRVLLENAELSAHLFSPPDAGQGQESQSEGPGPAHLQAPDRL
jgi:hypothetical protein